MKVMAALDVKPPPSETAKSPIEPPEGSIVDDQTTSIEIPEADSEEPTDSSALLSPTIPVPEELPAVRPSPDIENTTLPPEEPSAPRSTKYVTGEMRHFHYRDFKKEVVEASKTYPVLFQFYSDT
jgi:hypothetical protein